MPIGLAAAQLALSQDPKYGDLVESGLLTFRPSTEERVAAFRGLRDFTADDTEEHVINMLFNRIRQEFAQQPGWPFPTVIRRDPVVSVADNFDTLQFEAANPGRSSRYTHYLDDEMMLRTHNSAMVPPTLRDLAKTEFSDVLCLFPGRVYRRDVTDKTHLDAFHQLDVWRFRKGAPPMTTQDLMELVEVIFRAAAPGCEPIIRHVVHPYTLEGIEVSTMLNGEEVEVFEAGLAHPEVLRETGHDPSEVSGLALGMGLERLVMARKQIPDIRYIYSDRYADQMRTLEPFIEGSANRLPSISRDLSVSARKGTELEDIADRIKTRLGDAADLVENIEIVEETPIEQLEPAAVEKLGIVPGQSNFLIRVTFGSPDHTLTRREVAPLHAAAYQAVHEGGPSMYAEMFERQIQEAAARESGAHDTASKTH